MLELQEAWHYDELPGYPKSELEVIGFQRGVRGDDSWGAPVHPQYELDAGKPLSFRFLMALDD